MSKKPGQVREMIEAIAEDAWCAPPLLPEQARELWACVWGDVGGALGCTYVPAVRCLKLQAAANESGCWWIWTSKGEAMYLTLSLARARFSGEVVPMDEATALSALESMRDTSSGDDRRALEWAIARLRDQG